MFVKFGIVVVVVMVVEVVVVIFIFVSLETPCQNVPKLQKHSNTVVRIFHHW